MVLVEITDYLFFFYNRTILFGFWKFEYPVFRSGGFELSYTPSFFTANQNQIENNSEEKHQYRS
jgi:hypothetical protein